MISPEYALPVTWPESLRHHVREVIWPLTGCPSPPPAEKTTTPSFHGHRIAFACRHLRYSGSGRVLIEQVAALEGTGAELLIVCFEDGADQAVVDEIHRRAPAVRAVVRGNRKLRSLRSLWRVVGPFRPDYWVCTDTPDPLVLADKIARYRFFPVPRLAVVLHEEYDRYLGILEPWLSRIDAFLLDYDFRSTVQRRVGGSIPMDVVAPLFPLPVRTENAEVARRRLREAQGIPIAANVLGYAGRLGPNKRIEAMLDMLGQLIREGRDNIWLLLAGDWELDEYRQAIEQRLEEPVSTPRGGRIVLKDRVVWVGALSDLTDVYAAMDCFLLFSKAEGFYPLSVMEAQRLGCPVICTGAGGLSRVLLDGVTGFLVPGMPTSAGIEWTTESQRMALERLRYLLDHPTEARTMGLNGQRVVEWLTAVYPFRTLFRQWMVKRLKEIGTP